MKLKKGKFNFKLFVISWFLGIIFSFLFFTLLPWFLAYYNYIDLGLPSRFDYQKVNNEIVTNIPRGYSYSLIKTDTFRPNMSDSLIVYANSEDYHKWTIANNDTSKLRNGVLLILDKTDKGYKVSYKYQLITNDSEMNNLGIRIFKPITKDFDNDGKDEILTIWHAIGADLWPGFFVLYDDSKLVELKSPDAIDLGSRNSFYPDMMIENVYNHQEKLKIKLSEYITYNNKNIMVNYVIDNECKACDHKWRSLIYSFYEGNLVKGNELFFDNNKQLDKYEDDNNYVNIFTE